MAGSFPSARITSRRGAMSDLADLLAGSPVRPGGLLITNRAFDICALRPGSRVLDAGCGSGVTVRHAHGERGYEAHGFDIDRGVLPDDGRCFCAAAERMPISSECCDAVLCECSYSLMQDHPAVLGECRRVLKPGAWLVISNVYARDESASWQRGIGRIDRADVTLSMLTEFGFAIHAFEDFSRCLVEWWGERVLAGAVDTGPRCGVARPAVMKRVKPGYCLIVARRS
jgi:arsenite methyltransferase